jgi:hypothetical protein
MWIFTTGFLGLQSFSVFDANNQQWRVITAGSLATGTDELALKIDSVVVFYDEVIAFVINNAMYHW